MTGLGVFVSTSCVGLGWMTYSVIQAEMDKPGAGGCAQHVHLVSDTRSKLRAGFSRQCKGHQDPPALVEHRRGSGCDTLHVTVVTVLIKFWKIRILHFQQ